jgi:hypothetical protein
MTVLCHGAYEFRSSLFRGSGADFGTVFRWGWHCAVVILDLVFSFAKMRSHVRLDVTVKAGSMPETTVLADT